MLEKVYHNHTDKATSSLVCVPRVWAPACGQGGRRGPVTGGSAYLQLWRRFQPRDISLESRCRSLHPPPKFISLPSLLSLVWPENVLGSLWSRDVLEGHFVPVINPPSSGREVEGSPGYPGGLSPSLLAPRKALPRVWDHHSIRHRPCPGR